MRTRRWVRVAWVLTGAIVLLLLVKFFVADVYRVDSGSMLPTLFGGRVRADEEEHTEHVVVLYDRDLEPERFDLAVIRSPDGTEPLVKRVCGVPGDQDLQIRDGDLFFASRRLPPDAPRPPPIVVYDDRWLDPERFFGDREDGSVQRVGAEWIVAADAQPPGSLLHYHPALRDDFLDRDHRRVPGIVEVNDAVLELEFLLEAPLAAQKLRFQLVEEGDTFEVVITAAAEGPATLRLVRRNARTLLAIAPDPRELVLAEAPCTLVPERWYRLRFANVDNHLLCTSTVGPELARSYDENEPLRREDTLSPLPPTVKHLGSRVRFGVEAGRARFRAVRILRDLYYTDGGRGARFATEVPVSLGPGEYFLLGDNSAASTDSRHFGPVEAEALLGRPLAVVWPEPRWLTPALAP
jgi:hypothetical protein